MNWAQVKTILWLRWRLTRNQFVRAGAIGAILAGLMLAGAVILSAGGFIGGFAAGLLAFDKAAPLVFLLTWDGLTLFFLLFWMVGLLLELQRSESIDLPRLMHLPVALGPVFFFNYLASHLVLSILFMVATMIGMALGLMFGRGPAMGLLVPLALSMVFMVTAWTYCLRGWLATLMTRPRKRRTVIMVITMVFIVGGQLPSLYFNLMQRRFHPPPKAGATPEEIRQQHRAGATAGKQFLDLFIVAQKFVPPFWLPTGAHALAEGRAWPALLGTLGCAGLGALGLRRAYRSTVRFYHGGNGGKAVVPASRPAGEAARAAMPVRSGPRKPLLVERRLPGVPEQAAAVGLATLRSLLRAPEVKMAWGTTFIVLLVFGAMLFVNGPGEMPEPVRPFAVSGAVAVTLFMLAQFMGNQFGFDRAGFRAVVLAPVERRHVLLGKNLANIPVALVSGLTFLTLSCWRLHLTPDLFLSGVCQLLAMFLLMSVLGNWLSIVAPYRIQAGSMKATKLPAKAMLMMFASHMLFPIMMIPALLAPLAELLWKHFGGPGGVPVSLIVSAGVMVLAVIVYWRTLDPLGRLLQRREMTMLVQFGTEVE